MRYSSQRVMKRRYTEIKGLEIVAWSDFADLELNSRLLSTDN